MLGMWQELNNGHHGCRVAGGWRRKIGPRWVGREAGPSKETFYFSCSVMPVVVSKQGGDTTCFSVLKVTWATLWTMDGKEICAGQGRCWG